MQAPRKTSMDALTTPQRDILESSDCATSSDIVPLSQDSLHRMSELNGILQSFDPSHHNTPSHAYHPSQSPRHDRTHSQPEITPRSPPTFPRICIHNFKVIHHSWPNILHIAARHTTARVDTHRHPSRRVQIQHQRRLKRVLWPHACRHGV